MAAKVQSKNVIGRKRMCIDSDRSLGFKFNEESIGLSGYKSSALLLTLR